jgi:hypothetical protein
MAGPFPVAIGREGLFRPLARAPSPGRGRLSLRRKRTRRVSHPGSDSALHWVLFCQSIGSRPSPSDFYLFELSGLSAFLEPLIFKRARRLHVACRWPPAGFSSSFALRLVEGVSGRHVGLAGFYFSVWSISTEAVVGTPPRRGLLQDAGRALPVAAGRLQPPALSSREAAFARSRSLCTAAAIRCS